MATTIVAPAPEPSVGLADPALAAGAPGAELTGFAAGSPAKLARAADMAEGVVFYGLLILGIAMPILGALVGWLSRH